MSQVDLFAIRNSNLNEFLYSDVGIELNGSGLTILSMLARLGEDPWTQARLWAQAPKVKAIDWLAASISRMPLSSDGIENAHSTASRLVLLLPSQSALLGRHSASGPNSSLRSRPLRIIFLFSFLLIWMAMTTTFLSIGQKPVEGPVAQTTAHVR